MYLIRKTKGKLKDMVLFSDEYLTSNLQDWLEKYLEIKKPQTTHKTNKEQTLVVELNDFNYNNEIFDSNKAWFVSFYAP